MSPLSDSELRDMSQRAGIPSATISEHRLCRQCEYDLIGLPSNGICPECGTSIISGFGQSSSSDTDTPPGRRGHDNLLQFPRQRLVLLRAGLLLMAIAVPVLILLPMIARHFDDLVESPLAAGLYTACALMWLAGVYTVSSTPMPSDHIPYKVRGWYHSLGWMSLVSQVCWVFAGVAWFGYTNNADDTWRQAAILFRVLAVVGLVPICWQMSVLGRAAHDETVADRLWTIAWVLPSATLLLAGMSLIDARILSLCGGLAFMFIFGVTVLVTQLLLVLSVFHLQRNVAWSVSKYDSEADRAIRLRERAEERALRMMSAQGEGDLTLDDAPAAHHSKPATLQPNQSQHGRPTSSNQQTANQPPQLGQNVVNPSGDGSTYDIEQS